MAKRLACVLIFCLIVSTASKAHSLIVDLGGNTFLDQNTGYEWMKVGIFQNLTYTQIQNSLVSSDFRIATLSEVLQLQLSVPANPSEFDYYASVMGAINPLGGPPFVIQGFYDDGVNHTLSEAFLAREALNWQFVTYDFDINYQRDTLGAWVVRRPYASPVPEPSTFFLVAGGLLGTLIRSSRRKKG